VLWEALSGRRLWGSKPSLGDLVLAICTGPIPKLEKVAPWVPRELAEIVHHGLERDLDLRYPSMRAMATALEQFTGGAAVKERDLVAVSTEVRMGGRETPSWSPALPSQESPAPSDKTRTTSTRLRLVAWSLAVLFVALAGVLIQLL
jgi:serine/threonine-protein kinase